MLLPLLLLLSPPCAASELQWRAALGAELNDDSHGLADVGVKGPDWSVELLTDTLDLRWRPEGEHGRAWVALRGQAGAAGMFISPWADGAPAPERRFSSYAVGVQAGALRYLPLGFYAGGQAEARWQLFQAQEQTTEPAPADRGVLGADLLLGLWKPAGSAWLRAGLETWAVPDAGLHLAPHLQLQAELAPDLALAPVLGLHAGLAEGQDDLVTTRLGGLNPYVVPLAGAAWAEWWVEDYAALRLGLRGRLALEEGTTLSLMPFADAAVAEGIHSSRPGDPWGLGFGAWLGARKGRGSGDLALGYAPWIERQPEVGRLSLFVRLAVDWGQGSRIWRPQG